MWLHKSTTSGCRACILCGVTSKGEDQDQKPTNVNTLIFNVELEHAIQINNPDQQNHDLGKDVYGKPGHMHI